MTAYDAVLVGGTVVGGTGTRRTDLAIRGSRIVELQQPAHRAEVGVVMDVSGRMLLPGLIDSHVHFRVPGMSHKEDWACGSRAAVAGGVTTVIDMPNTRPPLTTPADAWDRHRQIEGRSLVDYRFHAGVAPGLVSRVTAFSPREASSVKVFLSGHHSAPDVLRDPAELEELFAIAAKREFVLLFHAEDDGVLALLDSWRGPPQTHRDHETHRPRTGGIVAVARLVDLARRYGTRTHVLHVSSQEEADVLTAAAASGIPISFEVTGHHLTYTNADLERLGSLIRLRPAIRTADDRARLWQAVTDGHATTVGSDHAPHHAEEKALPFADAPPGMPGVQELLPTLYTGLVERHPTASPAELLPIIVRVLCEGPARLFGLADCKGALEPGRDADVVVFDPERRWRLDRDTIYAKCGWSAYHGRWFTGAVDLTMRRGQVVYRNLADGSFFGNPDGTWLP